MNSTLAAAPALGVWPPMGTTATSGSSSRSGSNGSSSSSSVLQDSGTDTPALSFSLSDTPRSSHHFALFTPTLAPSTASSSKHSSTQQLHFASPSQEQQLYFHQQQQQQQPRLHIPGLKSGAQLTPASLSAVAPPLSPGATSPSLEKLALFAQSKSLALKERSSELAATLSSTTVNAGALAAPTSATATTLGHKSHDSAAGTLRLASTERQGAAVGLQAGDASMTLDPPEPQVGAVGPSAASNGPSVPALSSSALHALGIDFPEPSQQAPPPYTKQQLQPLQQTHPTLFSAAPFQQRQAHASGASPKGHHHARSHSHHVQQQKPYDFGEGATHSPLTRAPQSPHTTDQQHLRSHPHAQGPKQQHQQNQQHQHKHVQQATTQVVVPPSKPERVCRGEDFGIRIGDFDLLDTLGTGTFGKVILARLRPCPDRRPLQRDVPLYFAIKVLDKSTIVRLRQVEHLNSERQILASVTHPFLVNLTCTFRDERNLYIVMEYVRGGELFSHLRRAGRFSPDVSRFYAANLVLAIEYLHARDVVYRDLKPENILLGADGYVKLADFGFAKQVKDRTYTVCGTPEYLAPEIITASGHGKAVDWWALGVLLFELLAGYPPFFDENPLAIYERILSGGYTFPPHIDVVARDLIQRLLTPDLSKRLGNLHGGAADIKSHRWFQGVDWNAVEHSQIRAPIVPYPAPPGDTSNFERYPPASLEEMPGPLREMRAMQFGIDPDSLERGQDPYGYLFPHF